VDKTYVFLFLTFVLLPCLALSQNITFNSTENSSVVFPNLTDSDNITMNETFQNVSEEISTQKSLIIRSIDKKIVNNSLSIEVLGWIGFSNQTPIQGSIIKISLTYLNTTLTNFEISDENGNFKTKFEGLPLNQTFSLEVSFEKQIIRREVEGCEEQISLNIEEKYFSSPVNFTITSSGSYAELTISSEKPFYYLYLDFSNSSSQEISLNLPNGTYSVRVVGECKEIEKRIDVILNESKYIESKPEIYGNNIFYEDEEIKLKVCFEVNQTLDAKLTGKNITLFYHLMFPEECQEIAFKNLTIGNYSFFTNSSGFLTFFNFSVLPRKVENLTVEDISINKTYVENRTFEINKTISYENLSFPMILSGENLALNLTYGISDQGILIFEARNVSINCNGNVIRGSQSRTPGIFVLNSENIKIKGCNINGFIFGLVSFNSSELLFEDIELKNNENGLLFFYSKGIRMKNVESLENLGIGMFVYNSEIAEFLNSRIKSTLGLSQLLKINEIKKEVSSLVGSFV